MYFVCEATKATPTTSLVFTLNNGFKPVEHTICINVDGYSINYIDYNGRCYIRSTLPVGGRAAIFAVYLYR